MITATLACALVASFLSLGSAAESGAAGFRVYTRDMIMLDGIKFDSKEGRFSVTLPEGYSKPKLDAKDVPSALGKLKLYMYTSMGDEGVCLVGYSDIKGVKLTDEVRNAMLDGAKNGAMENINGELIDEQVISLDGNPGRSIRFTAPMAGQTGYGRFDYFMVGSRLYQLGYLGFNEGALDDAQVVAYFDSFELTKKKAKGK